MHVVVEISVASSPYPAVWVPSVTANFVGRYATELLDCFVHGVLIFEVSFARGRVLARDDVVIARDYEMIAQRAWQTFESTNERPDEIPLSRNFGRGTVTRGYIYA